LGSAILLGNTFYFQHVLTAQSPLQGLATALVYVAAFVLAASLAGGVRLALLFAAFHLVLWPMSARPPNGGVGTALHSRMALDAASPGVKARRSVYVIGIDGMASRAAYAKLYDDSKPSPAYEWLAGSGYDLYDILSPGDQTLTSYGALFRLSGEVHPRTVRRLFNGQESSPFYDHLQALGFSRQFFYIDNYFGEDAGRIESFFPQSSGVSFCSYADDRWGYYFCRLYRSGSDRSQVSEQDVSAHFDFWSARVQFDRQRPWFSIHHIWFPGHTLGAYDGRLATDRKRFRDYYVGAQAGLTTLVRRITERVRAADPDAAIVFFGDHGGYLLHGVQPGDDLSELGGPATANIVLLDARGVLLTVMPAGFCRNELATMLTSANLFMVLADCASR
jgi:hypothetical protein